MSTRVINPLRHAFFLGFNRFEIYYSGVLRVASYEFELKKLLHWYDIWSGANPRGVPKVRAPPPPPKKIKI